MWYLEQWDYLRDANMILLDNTDMLMHIQDKNINIR